MLINILEKNNLIQSPKWLSSNIHYLAYSGSIAYNTNNADSDIDLFGFCTPPKHVIFPHLAGIIKDFGHQGEEFNRFHQQCTYDNKEYDVSILNIVRFMHLCLQNNPDQIDVLFVPRECIIHITKTGEYIRENRHKFLSKQAYYKYRGYAISQLTKATKENPIGKRKLLKDKFGFDPKFLCHLYRLVLECEQILSTNDLDLRRDCEQIRYVKEGHVPLNEAAEWFALKDKHLTQLYYDSKLPEKADEDEIKTILLNAIEIHYGSVSKSIQKPSDENVLIKALLKIKSAVQEALPQEI